LGLERCGQLLDVELLLGRAGLLGDEVDADGDGGQGHLAVNDEGRDADGAVQRKLGALALQLVHGELVVGYAIDGRRLEHELCA
jgi:hypothetical protein